MHSEIKLMFEVKKMEDSHHSEYVKGSYLDDLFISLSVAEPKTFAICREEDKKTTFLDSSTENVLLGGNILKEAGVRDRRCFSGMEANNSAPKALWIPNMLQKQKVIIYTMNKAHNMKTPIITCCHTTLAWLSNIIIPIEGRSVHLVYFHGLKFVPKINGST